MTSRAIVYLRFPFPRNGFEDPQNADWNNAKERLLWDILSKSTNRQNIDWSELASRLDVPVPFVLQQAALLYEKELERVRVHMKNVRVRNSSRPVSRTRTDIEHSSSPVSDASSRTSSNAKSRRLLSQSRRLGFRTKYDVEDDGSDLYEAETQKESSSLTDFSQGSITKSALAEAINDITDEFSSSAASKND